MFAYLEQFDIPEEKFHPLYADGASFIIGQEQDGFPYGGRFDWNQGFSGKITQMEIWNTILTSQEISEIAFCLKSSVKPQKRVVTWSTEAWTSIKMEPLKEIPLEDICKENPLVDQFIWPDKLNFVTLSYYCEIVGGNFFFYYHQIINIIYNYLQ